MIVPSARVGDLAEQVRGVTYGKDDASRTPGAGYLPVLRAGNITDTGLVFDDLVYVPAAKVSAKQKIKRGDIVIAASSGSLDVVGKAAPALAAFDGGFGAFCKVIRPNHKVDPGYLAQFFKTPGYRRKISSLAAGANINNLKSEHLDDLLVPVPTLPEQRRIAAILDQADALRAKRREALAQLDSLTQSIFIEMFGDPRRAGSTGSEPTEQRLLGELARIRTGKLDANAADEDGVYPFFTCAVQTLRINTAAFDCKATLVAGNGDLNVKYYEGKFNAYQRTYVIESMNERLLVPRFLFAFLDLYVAELRKQAIGGVIKYIKLPYLTDAVMQVPDERAQIEFAARLVQVERIKAAQVRAATETEALFTSLQHRAFSGQLS